MLPTLLGSRPIACGFDFDEKTKAIPETKAPQTFPEVRSVPFRIRNTFIDIPEDEELPAGHQCCSAPARHAGRIEQQWQEDAGARPLVKGPDEGRATVEPQRQVVILESALGFPGSPEASHVQSRRRLRMVDEVSYETSQPADQSHAGAPPAAAAALGLVCPAAPSAEAPQHAIYPAEEPQVQQAFDSALGAEHALAHWQGSQIPLPSDHGYHGHNGYGAESMHQTHPVFQVCPGSHVFSSLRADATPWYGSQGQIRDDVAMQPQVTQLPPAMLQPSPAPAEPAPGTLELPSIGSQGHGRGDCKPCAFLHTKGCDNGAMCKFCHICDAGEKKRRQKEKRQMIRGGA